MERDKVKAGIKKTLIAMQREAPLGYITPHLERIMCLVDLIDDVCEEQLDKCRHFHLAEPHKGKYRCCYFDAPVCKIRAGVCAMLIPPVRRRQSPQSYGG